MKPLPLLLTVHDRKQKRNRRTTRWLVLASGVNSLVPGRCGNNLKCRLISEQMLRIKLMCIYCEIVRKWMPQNILNDKSTFDHVMAWCRQATSHYVNQWWSKFMTPYAVTRPQCVKTVMIRTHPNKETDGFQTSLHFGAIVYLTHCGIEEIS